MTTVQIKEGKFRCVTIGLRGVLEENTREGQKISFWKEKWMRYFLQNLR